MKQLKPNMPRPQNNIELKRSAGSRNRSQEIQTSSSIAASPSRVQDKRRQDKKTEQRLLLRFRRKLATSADDIMALWTPVTVSVLTASAMTQLRKAGQRNEPISHVTGGEPPFLQSEVDLNAQQIVRADSEEPGISNLHLVLIICLIAVVVIVVMSFVMILLLKLNCFRCLKGYICVAFVILGCHFAVFWLYTASNALLIPVDWITAIVLTYNFLAMVALTMALGHSAPKRLIQVMHVILSAAVAYIIANLLLKGNFTYASLLCVAFSLWDLFAVLCPRGPLNSLIRMAEGESRVTDFMQPLVYTAAVWTTATIVTSKPKEKIRRGSRLGLGDFIFYGVLVATATNQCGPFGGLACYTALTFGFCLTLVGLRCLGRALPALPLPVAAAVAAVCILDGCGIAFSEALAERQLML